MKRWNLLPFFCLAALAPTVGFGQTKAKPKQAPPRTLAAEIQAMKWDAAKSGALLALDAANVQTRSTDGGLATFGRKKVVMGEVTAIAPINMVLINDRLDEPPNLYDGLPADAKALYLLSTLTPEQLKAATTRGIGMSDLAGEQRSVLQSLLPKPFKYESARVDDDGIMSDPIDKKTLSESDSAKVRVRFTRALQFQMDLRDMPRSMTFHDTNEEYGRPGDTVYTRDDRDDFDRGDSFGIQRKVIQDNKLKPSALKYDDKSLDNPVTLSPSVPLAKLVQQAGNAAGLEIHCDLRIGDLVVTSIGSKARVGDILKAAALMVTGAYRKVGDVYILTSDLVGMGTRKLALSIFENELRNSVYDKQEEWRKQIGKTGIAARVPFDKSDPLAPNDGLLKRLEQSDATYQPGRISAQEMTPAIRGFLNRVNKRYSSQPVDTQNVGVQSYIQFGYVLPNGQPLHAERISLGIAPSFNPPAYPPRGGNFPTPKMGTMPAEGTPFPLMVSVTTPSAAEQAISDASTFGFREVWVKTRRKGAIEAAAKAAKSLGLAIRLVIEPWEVSDEEAPADPDRTLLGDTAAAAMIRIANSAEWKRNQRFYQGDPLDLKETVTPYTPNLAGRWTALADLAKTPGVSGVVMLGTEPGGYEPAVSRSTYGSYTKTMASLALFGYSISQRTAFIRAKQLDPIDIAWQGWMGMSDTRQPFFLDDAQRGGSSVYDGNDNPHAGMDEAMATWAQFRFKANEAAMIDLVKKIGDVPILMEMRKGTQNYPAIINSSLVPLTPGAALPTLPVDTAYIKEITPGSYSLIQLPKTWPLDPADQRAAQMVYMFANISQMDKAAGREFLITFDATRIPSEKLATMLAHWLDPVKK